MALRERLSLVDLAPVRSERPRNLQQALVQPAQPAIPGFLETLFGQRPRRFDPATGREMVFGGLDPTTGVIHEGWYVPGKKLGKGVEVSGI